MSVTSQSQPPGYSERSLAIIKPEAYEDAEAIENILRKNGFSVLAKRIVHMTPEQAAELYQDHYGKHHFPHLVAHMSSGPVVAMVLACANAIEKLRALMGPARVQEAQAYWPDSIRASFGRRTNYGDFFNAIHGSSSHSEALREIHFFFPNMIVGPILQQWQIKDYIQKHITPTLTPALTKLAYEKPDEPILWLAEYLRNHNPNEPRITPEEVADDERCHSSDSEKENGK